MKLILQAFLLFAIASQVTAQSVHFGVGEYHFDKPIQLREGERLSGDGYNTILRFSGDGIIAANQCTIENLRIYGNGADSETVGIKFDKASRNRVRNVYVGHFGTGVLYRDSFLTIFSDCYLNWCRVGFRTPADGKYANAVTIRDGGIEKNSIGVELKGISKGLTISSVAIEGNKEFGLISPEGDRLPPVSLRILDCHFESNGNADIQLSGRTDHAHILRNRFSGKTKANILIGNSSEPVVGTRIRDNDHIRGVPIEIGAKSFRTVVRPGYDHRVRLVDVIDSGQQTVIENEKRE